MKDKSPKIVLEEYYKKTAPRYDEAHQQEVEHDVALKIMAGIASSFSIKNILDVGARTGRGSRLFSQILPHVNVVSIDLSRDLLQEGIRKTSLSAQRVCVANATKLPFPDDAFDLSLETAALHHVPDSAAVVKEMPRLAKFGIVISDSNMYVDGSSRGFLPKGLVGSVIKFALYKTGVWKTLKKLCTGKEWSYSEGEGVFWTYSAYETLLLLKEQCTQVFTIPLKGKEWMSEILLLSALRMLVIGMKNRLGACGKN